MLSYSLSGPLQSSAGFTHSIHSYLEIKSWGRAAGVLVGHGADISQGKVALASRAVDHDEGGVVVSCHSSLALSPQIDSLRGRLGDEERVWLTEEGPL